MKKNDEELRELLGHFRKAPEWMRRGLSVSLFAWLVSMAGLYIYGHITYDLYPMYVKFRLLWLRHLFEQMHNLSMVMFVVGSALVFYYGVRFLSFSRSLSAAPPPPPADVFSGTVKTLLGSGMFLIVVFMGLLEEDDIFLGVAQASLALGVVFGVLGLVVALRNFRRNVKVVVEIV